MVNVPTGVNRVARLALPVLALIASLMPWVTVGVVTKTRHWNAYQVTPLTLGWLVLDMAALALSIRSQNRPVSPALSIAWVLLAATSLGGASAAFVMVGVSQHVSQILSAPNPLQLGWGLKAFAVIAALWTATAWMSWPTP